MSKFRKKLSNNGSKRYFSATADKTHPKNVRNMPMRGGIRF